MNRSVSRIASRRLRAASHVRLSAEASMTSGRANRQQPLPAKSLLTGIFTGIFLKNGRQRAISARISPYFSEACMAKSLLGRTGISRSGNREKFRADQGIQRGSASDDKACGMVSLTSSFKPSFTGAVGA
jgi:hypothetical protein